MPQFQAANVRELRRRGIEGGRVTVTVGDGAVHLAGDGGGSLTIPVNAIARVRIGFVEAKRRIYQLHRSKGRLVRLRDGRPMNGQRRDRSNCVRRTSNLKRVNQFLSGDRSGMALPIGSSAGGSGPHGALQNPAGDRDNQTARPEREAWRWAL